MFLVGWDSICQPKWFGGLGMRQSKYGMKDSLPASIAKVKSSFL
ncbi:hypothetical protein V6Z11_A02G096000 [Gossypium hirsutum]